ncbi:hypothetical protein F2P81_011509 [Scophthalmus maximus]|uniref:Uncharacterized protein n=1 Tax=Scophthalmus maximus TaxID=52904 RepID=A0A6A4SS02_SCOMX|nr:hypothetical protein F2P81_011509 [Scophthalmus maximus]
MCASFTASNSTLKPQRKERVGSQRTEQERGRTGRKEERKEKGGRTKNKPPTPTTIYTATLNPTLSQKGREKNLRTPVGIASTTQAYSYANFAVSVSTVAVLTGRAVHTICTEDSSEIPKCIDTESPPQRSLFD